MGKGSKGILLKSALHAGALHLADALTSESAAAAAKTPGSEEAKAGETKDTGGGTMW